MSSILEKDLSAVDTSMPLLPKDDYLLTVKEVTVVDNKAKTGQLVKITLTTTGPATSVKGEPIAPGFYIFDQISLEPTDKYPVSQIEKRLKTFRQGVTGEKGGSFMPVEQYNGKNVTARVKVQQGDGDYPEKNAIAFYKTE